MPKTFFTKFFQDIKSDWNKIMLLIYYRLLKYKAFRIHKKYNCQVFVVKIAGKVRIISKYQFKKTRQKGHIPLNFTATELKAISLYYTPRKYDETRA